MTTRKEKDGMDILADQINKTKAAKEKSQHTPTPWVAVEKEGRRTLLVSGGPRFTGETIGAIDRKENAAFIVRAVNAHEELLEVLYWLLGNSKAGGAQAERISQAIAKAKMK